MIENENKYRAPEITVLMLEEIVKFNLPEFYQACHTEGADVILNHQDAFAADYQLGEFTLLGMAVKYAGVVGKTIEIHGRNGETFRKAFPGN